MALSFQNSISVVIPNYNGADLLRANLPAILEAKKLKDNSISEVIVVDDGSTDESIRVLQNEFPSVKLIKHSINRGFAAAVNTGFKLAKGNLVALLNSDVIPEQNFLVSVIPHFNDIKVFGVSLHEKGFGPARGKFLNGFIVHEPGAESKTTQKTFWVSGGSGVFNKKKWWDLGGFDEKLFAPFYWEDVDMGYRALKRGWQLFWEPDAKVLHEHESTIRKSKYAMRTRKRIVERNQLLFIWKNLTSDRLFRKHLRGILRRISRSPGYLIIVIMALSKFGLVLKARKRESRESKVADEAVLSQF